ncbi:trans-aconitate 2-methyltransferase [Haloechinothrix halophila]|uniref:trans-aconitate 2-methyltransferase n=1 Tax=Haloechinothrix halophila TaxID=1069073 RepID=UPI00041CBA3A|nr:trans-aconitate 2-methyltransferase [Haloechinothrix halophila]
MRWDPEAYLGYAGVRSRPYFDLIVRIDERSPRRVADLGCGPGHLTQALAQRWPSAALEAWDSSADMVREAQARGIDARLGDVRDWAPKPDTDVVICNAVLHWVPDHIDLLRKWVSALQPGAWLAVAMPRNIDEPSHTLVRELANEPRWRDLVAEVVAPATDVLDAVSYAGLYADLGCEIDAWETNYIQRLMGDDPVLEWLSGTTLRPVKTALDDETWQRFRDELAPRLRAAYPRRDDGTTLFPFRRVFAVARVR